MFQKQIMNCSPIHEADAQLSAIQRKNISYALNSILEKIYTLMLQTQICFWKLESSGNDPLKRLVENTYGDLFEELNLLARRSEDLGFRKTSGIVDSIPEISRTMELTGGSSIPSIALLIGQMMKGHEELICEIQSLIDSPDLKSDFATLEILALGRAMHERALFDLSLNEHSMAA